MDHKSKSHSFDYNTSAITCRTKTSIIMECSNHFSEEWLVFTEKHFGQEKRIILSEVCKYVLNVGFRQPETLLA